MPLLPIIAQAVQATPELPDPNSAQSVGWLILTLSALVAAGNQGMGFLAKLRAARTAVPGEVSSDRVKALEDRVHNMELKWENHMGQISAKFETISQTLTNLQSDWNYALGRIDGRQESTKTQER